MSQQVVVKASEGHRAFGKLLKQVYSSNKHFIVERDGFPVVVMMSYQEYEQFRKAEAVSPIQKNLPPTMSLEESFGSVTPLNQPEDFAALREAAIEEHVQKVVAKMKSE